MVSAGEPADDAAVGAGQGLDLLPERVEQRRAAPPAARFCRLAALEELLFDDVGRVGQFRGDEVLLAADGATCAALRAAGVYDAAWFALPAFGVATGGVAHDVLLALSLCRSVCLNGSFNRYYRALPRFRIKNEPLAE